MIVLVDTNILLDVLQKRAPHHISADQLWALIESGSLVGYVSAISFNNIFYVARKQDGREKAIQSLAVVRNVFKTVSLDESLTDDALAVSPADFEDALQACAARRVQAEYVVTRNCSDFKALGVIAVTAEVFLALYHASESHVE